MHSLLLTPQDTLFFRDSRPMSGSLVGHGAFWPLPHTIHEAFHAALHRAGIESHEHHTGNYRTRDYATERNQKYGSLKTIGPFPVSPDGIWYFPAPTDLSGTALIEVPSSSLPTPLKYAFASTQTPNKEKPSAWISAATYAAYLAGQVPDQTPGPDFFDCEARIGIGIDPATQTQDGNRFYSAEYLRLRDNWKLGCLVEADDKDHGDLVFRFPPEIILGGQQGIVSLENGGSAQTLPHPPTITTPRLRWTLLSPAIFPAIDFHPGGWLPSWIDCTNGAVLLRADRPCRCESESRIAYRERIAKLPALSATLIAARISKPQSFSGWDLLTGPKPTQFAVPAGSCYVFDCGTIANAQKLADALNPPNRRSTLCGEKGFGIGICSSITPAQD